MKKYINLLKNVWFSEKSSLIYLSLLENWKSSIADITNNTSLHRVEIYRLLPNLIESGFLLISLKWKRKFYSPVNPQKIEEIYLENLEKNKRSIWELSNMYLSIEKKPKVIYSSGKKWIMHVFSDIVNSLEKWGIFYRITSETNTHKVNDFLPKNYRELRDKKQLERYVIMSHKAALTKKPRLERELVAIPEEYDQFRDDIFMTIYANKVAYIDFNTQSSIIIENKQIAKFQEKAFMLMFKSLRK